MTSGWLPAVIVPTNQPCAVQFPVTTPPPPHGPFFASTCVVVDDRGVLIEAMFGALRLLDAGGPFSDWHVAIGYAQRSLQGVMTEEPTLPAPDPRLMSEQVPGDRGKP